MEQWILSTIPVIESPTTPRGTAIFVSKEAFMDAPTVPAVVMNAFDAAALKIAAAGGGRMSDPSVQLAALHEVVTRRADEAAGRASRPQDRMVAAMNEPRVERDQSIGDAT